MSMIKYKPQTFEVTCWNTYSTLGDGIKVMSGPVRAATAREAMDKTQLAVLAANRLADEAEEGQPAPLRINFLTCGVFLRAIN